VRTSTSRIRREATLCLCWSEWVNRTECRLPCQQDIVDKARIGDVRQALVKM
jgi:hypothetical protein